MLRIRPEQYEELGTISLKRFEDEMVVHLKRFFPKYYEVYGESLIRTVIRYGVERAETHGFVTKRDTPLYIDLMLLLGSRFDEDPQYPWAAAVLKDTAIKDPTRRVDVLYDAAVGFLDTVAGKENEFLGRAMLRIREFPFPGDFSPQLTANWAPRVATLLKNIWPQKHEALGERLILQMLDRVVEHLRTHKMVSEQGLVLSSLLGFLLGTDFCNDPQFPWVAAVLNEASIKTPEDRIQRLYEAAISYMSRWL